MNPIELDSKYVMNTYRRQPVCFVKGQGTRLWDTDGKEYIDFLAGVAVCGLGHCHPAVTKTIQEQAAKLLHVSNVFVNEAGPALAEELAQRTGMEKAFFANTGAEAVETAIKLAKKFGKDKGIARPEIIVMAGGFHGRTIGALSATMNPLYQNPFKPLLEGFITVPRNDVGALESAITPNTCAILVEPIQGETGVHVLTSEYLMRARDLANQHGLLLIADEIQAGVGRTGKFLSIQHIGVMPDVVTLAKGLANGIPIGVCLARGVAADVLGFGQHGATFGGNPFACTVALTVLRVLDEDHILENATEVGDYLMAALRKVEGITEVRGKGLMIGAQLAQPVAVNAVAELLEKGFVAVAVGDSVIRMLPPLILTKEECDQLVSAIHTLGLAKEEVLA